MTDSSIEARTLAELELVVREVWASVGDPNEAVVQADRTSMSDDGWGMGGEIPADRVVAGFGISTPIDGSCVVDLPAW